MLGDRKFGCAAVRSSESSDLAPKVTIRLDDDVIAWFKHEVTEAGGGNYQSLINSALRDYIAQRAEPLEETLRKVIREELKHAS